MQQGSASVDNYELTETVIESSEGIIYRAVEKSSNTKVFLKKYYPALQWSEDALNEFFDLLSYLRYIEHEFLLPVLDVGKHDGVPYVVFVDDDFTFLSLPAARPRSEKEILDFLHHLAEAIDFLHKQEVLHGGLSIDNIAIDANGYPLVFDFGLSGVFKKLLLENVDEGFENLSVGSLKCTSPEQILGRTATRASDIYSYGILSYFVIFGELPFDGRYVPETAVSHFSDGIIQTVQMPLGVSRETLKFIQKCIQLNPESRFLSVSDVLKNLERMLAGRKVRLRFEKRVAFQRPPIRFPVSRSFAVVTIFILGLLGSSYLYMRNAQAVQQTSLSATGTAAASSAVTIQPATETKPPFIPTLTESSPTLPPATVTPRQRVYQLAFEGGTPFSVGDVISIANLSDLREISRLGFGKPEEAAATPDQTHLAVATSIGVILYEGNRFQKWIDPQGWATSVQFSPDGNTLVIGLANGDIQLWDWQTNTQLEPLTGEWHHTNRVNRLIFSQGGFLYSASDDQQFIVWDLSIKKSIFGKLAHSRPINDIAVTSDSRTLISCSDDRLIRVWDLASGQKLYELSASSLDFTGAIKAIAISSDDAYFAAGGESGYLYQWNLVTSASPPAPLPQRRTDIVPVKDRIWSLQYVREDQDLIVGVDKGTAITYEAAREKYGGISPDFDILPQPLDLVDVFGPRFDFDSHSIPYADGTVSLNWDGEVSAQDTQLISPRYDILDRLDFSPDGTVLAAGGRRGTTHVWDLTNNDALLKNLYFIPIGDPIAPDGSSIVQIVPKTITTDEGNVLIEDYYQVKNLTGAQSTRDLTQALRGAHVGYTSNGSLFIAANMDASRAWDSDTGNETHLAGYRYIGCWITSSENDPKNRLQVNSAAGILPSVDDAHIESLCPRTNQFRNSLVAFSDDLSLMVFENANGLLEAYDVLEKKSPWPPYRMENSISALAVSPDGSVVAVGDVLGNMLFLNGETGELISQVPGNFGKLETIRFSADGIKLATAGDDGAVRVFGIVNP